jgi:hypothetical protein
MCVAKRSTLRPQVRAILNTLQERRLAFAEKVPEPKRPEQLELLALGEPGETESEE